MPDNFTPDDIIEQLIKYLDGELTDEEKTAVEHLLNSDALIKERYDNLVAARDAVRLKGIQQKVQALHQQYYPLVSGQYQTARVIKPGFGKWKIFSAVAAIILLLFGSFVFYEYSATSNESVYAANFINYQVPVLRSQVTLDNIDSLFNAGNFTAVIQLTEIKQQRNQKNDLLLGLSYLQTGDANKAINALLDLQTLNNRSAEKSFSDEADYYLALAYIKSGKIDQAETLIGKITSNPKHLYYVKAKEISKTTFTFLKWKN